MTMTAEEAISELKKGPLPDAFRDYTATRFDGMSVAHAAAEAGYLPADFAHWGVEFNGVTVAHTAARSRSLPATFTQWDLRDCNDNTVAHIAARAGCLPDGFEGWALARMDGRTVAHEAAMGALFLMPSKAWTGLAKTVVVWRTRRRGRGLFLSALTAGLWPAATAGR